MRLPAGFTGRSGFIRAIDLPFPTATKRGPASNIPNGYGFREIALVTMVAVDVVLQGLGILVGRIGFKGGIDQLACFLNMIRFQCGTGL